MRRADQRCYRPDQLGPADISRLLAERVHELVCQLLPGGKRQGRWFRAGSVTGEAGASLVVELTGPRRGKWRDYNGDPDAHGDLVDLVAWTRTSRDLKAAFAWSRQWLGLVPARTVSGAETARIKAATAEAVARDETRAARHAADNRARAERILGKAQPVTRGDPVDLYLKGRGIDLACLGRVPAALRYAPSLWYGPGQRFPTMVAAITDGAGEFVAIHRTFLKRQPDGSVTKAPVAEAKKTLGNYRGGSIKLWRGCSGRPWLNMPTRSTVVVAEGIEDALSALVGAEIRFPAHAGTVPLAPLPVSQLRVIAAVSGDNIAALELPRQVARLVILQQHDPAGSPAAIKLATAIEQLEGRGIEVLLLPPPAWAGVKDLNDLLRTLRATS